MSDILNAQLRHMLPDACVRATPLADTGLSLWLIDPKPVSRAFSAQEMIAILEHTPYWGFCWGSGLALARYILAYPDRIRGRRIIDFGSGSGVVAIAAASVGARVIACDIDPASQLACEQNAGLNQVRLDWADDLLALPENSADLLIAADVLYDRKNLSWLDTFLRYAPEVWVADSRVKDFSHPHYRLRERFTAATVPDMGEPEAFSDIRFYCSCIAAAGETGESL